MNLFNWFPTISLGNIIGVGAAWYLAYGGVNLMSIAVIILAWYLGDYLFPNPSMPLVPSNTQNVMNLHKPGGGGFNGGGLPPQVVPFV